MESFNSFSVLHNGYTVALLCGSWRSFFLIRYFPSTVLLQVQLNRPVHFAVPCVHLPAITSNEQIQGRHETAYFEFVNVGTKRRSSSCRCGVKHCMASGVCLEIWFCA
jgi:hypothetical protein